MGSFINDVNALRKEIMNFRGHSKNTRHSGGSGAGQGHQMKQGGEGGG